MGVVGTGLWQDFQRVMRAGRGEQFSRLARGGDYVAALPTGGTGSRLPLEWDGDVAHASYVIYHYGTPVAWIDSRDNRWVVPNVTYSATTSGCQKRIREAAGAFRDMPRG